MLAAHFVKLVNTTRSLITKNKSACFQRVFIAIRLAIFCHCDC